MGWEKKDDYHVQNGNWTVTRAVIGEGVERFVAWFGGGSPTVKRPGCHRIPRVFETAREVRDYIKWIEDNARDEIEVLKVDKPLTAQQLEMI